MTCNSCDIDYLYDISFISFLFCFTLITALLLAKYSLNIMLNSNLFVIMYTIKKSMPNACTFTTPLCDLYKLAHFFYDIIYPSQNDFLVIVFSVLLGVCVCVLGGGLVPVKVYLYVCHFSLKKYEVVYVSLCMPILPFGGLGYSFCWLYYSHVCVF